jgi:2-polyprenyl-3-methyl-5-hydroxy-6-metoxy-1,4-benzoquinol methylase
MLIKEQKSESIKILEQREQYRDQYWQKRDPIVKDRLLWRAQTFRHMVHLLPGQTILELGCGKGLFTQQLYHVSRGENEITAATFQDDLSLVELPSSVEVLSLSSIVEQLDGRQYDYVVAMDLLDKSNCSWLLQQVYKLLKPGGQIIFYESNPWNIFLQGSRLISRWFGKKDQRQLLNRTELYELMSELGFIKIFSVFNDFVYAPLTPKAVWVLRNMSIILENFPFVRTLAGSILIHAQKPAQQVVTPKVSLCDHPALKGAISVVVPCHNEEMNVGPLVSQLVNFYGEYLHEIVLVDDNSKDNTKEVIKKLAQQYPIINPVFRTPPNGVGRAIMDGYKKATGKYILSMDCDFQHLLPELRDLFDAAVEGHDVIVGSRFSRHSVLLNYPIQKIIANRGFHFLARIILKERFRDLTNNLKLIKREVVEKLPLSQPGFSINAETGFMPLMMGYDVEEVPISWINRTPDMGVSSFKLVKVGGGYWDVLSYLWKQASFNKKSVYYRKARVKARKVLVA